VQYMLITYETEAAFAARDGTDAPGYWAAWRAYTEALQAAGVLRSGNALLPATTATTLRTNAGKRLVQDGPMADTKEQLGGYYVIDVPDLDAALTWAARCPAASDGGVEVRPIMAM
jgi:hypothetical protein